MEEGEVKQQEKKQVVKKTDWNKNKFGTWWKNEQATFKNGKEEIQVWTEGPFRIKGNEAGKLQPGTTINYDEVMLQDGHVWVGYDSFEGERLYLPVREWNSVAPPNHGLDELWGTINCVKI
ncbi:SH3 domain-containing protein [Staphylococcus hyicus]|uniref:SH3 domain-containing protein n=1 Tax=Staphylococcus hyicus TaxID=1284 RepID=UPI003B75C50E